MKAKIQETQPVLRMGKTPVSAVADGVVWMPLLACPNSVRDFA
jgi:hypothetical protein